LLPSHAYKDSPPRRATATEPCIFSTGRFEQGVFLKGSGSIVLHPQIVITSAHVVARDGQHKERLKFQLYRRNDQFEELDATTVAFGDYDGRDGAGWRQNDWAIIVLDKAPQRVRPLGVAFPSAMQLLADYKHRLIAFGYSRFSQILPGSGDAFPVVSGQCSILMIFRRTPLYVYHGCSQMPGGSGGPIVTKSDSWCTVVGIAQGGTADADRGLNLVVPNVESQTHMNSAVLSLSFKSALAQVAIALNEGKSGREVARTMMAERKH
jgi:hypothetical protein